MTFWEFEFRNTNRKLIPGLRYIPTKEEEDDICPICHDLLFPQKNREQGQTYAEFKNVKDEKLCTPHITQHFSHTKCMKIWAEKNPICPVCRGKIGDPVPSEIPALSLISKELIIYDISPFLIVKHTVIYSIYHAPPTYAYNDIFWPNDQAISNLMISVVKGSSFFYSQSGRKSKITDQIIEMFRDNNILFNLFGLITMVERQHFSDKLNFKVNTGTYKKLAKEIGKLASPSNHNSYPIQEFKSANLFFQMQFPTSSMPRIPKNEAEQNQLNNILNYWVRFDNRTDFWDHIRNILDAWPKSVNNNNNMLNENLF